MCTKVDEAVAIVALFQALVAKHYRMRKDNTTFRIYRRDLIAENKWRAVRYGLDGKLLDLGKQAEVPTRDLMYELVDFVDDVLDDLGSRREVEYVFKILAEGTSADRQLQTYRETGDLKAVVDRVVAETVSGVPRQASSLTGG
jgi:carboxylate-amine ligase